MERFPEVPTGFRHTIPKAEQRIHSDGPRWKSDWISAQQNLSWLGLKFPIHATACLRLFKGQKLSKLQSMPDKIHTHRRISNIPNKLLLAWLYFEATSFHSSAVSFHSLFLPLECFCKAAYKLLALNKKMLGFFLLLFGWVFLKSIATATARSPLPPGLPLRLKTTVKQKRTENREHREIPYKPLRKPTHLFISIWLLCTPKMTQNVPRLSMQEVVVTVLQRLFCQLRSCLKIGFYFIRYFRKYEKGLLFYHYIACVHPVWFILLWHSFRALIRVFS